MISIVIPTYEMHGHGVEMLSELVESIHAQRYVDYEIVVSDGSNDDAIKWYCLSRARVRWVRGSCINAPANLNVAIEQSRGTIIKPMFQDDKFIQPDTLWKIAAAFTEHTNWIACQSQNGGEAGMRDDLFQPYPHSTLFHLAEGENTYGSPSAMAWRRNDMRFDDNLPWLFDCEFYARMAERYGPPAFIDSAVFIRQWSGMATNAVATGQQRVLDHNYVVEKYRAEGVVQ